MGISPYFSVENIERRLDRTRRLSRDGSVRGESNVAVVHLIGGDRRRQWPLLFGVSAELTCSPTVYPAPQTAVSQAWQASAGSDQPERRSTQDETDPKHRVQP